MQRESERMDARQHSKREVGIGAIDRQSQNDNHSGHTGRNKLSGVRGTLHSRRLKPELPHHSKQVRPLQRLPQGCRKQTIRFVRVRRAVGTDSDYWRRTVPVSRALDISRSALSVH